MSAAVAAALRCAARRTVGGRALQRTRAAIEEEQRRRLIHSGTPLSVPRVSPFAAASRSNTKGLTSENEGQIKKMKEELYTAIAKQERNNTIYDSLVSPNVRLLEYLSVQLDPKHNDPRWRSYRRGKRISDCLRIAGIYFLTTMAMDTLFGSSMEADPEGRATKRDLA